MAPNAILLSRYKFVRNLLFAHNERLYGRLPISPCKGFNMDSDFFLEMTFKVCALANNAKTSQLRISGRVEG